MKRSTVDEAIAALSAAEAPRDVLEAIGRLVVLGARDRIQVEAEIDLGIGELEEAAFAAIAAIEGADPIAAVRAALEVRDAVELRMIAAEALGRLELSLEEESSLVAFEEALRPHLWRFTALNEWRALEVAWLLPEQRARFWWWSEASDVDPRGAQHLDAVAELVARFPAAELQLKKLAATHLLMLRPAAAIIDLGAWIRERTRPLEMAASTGAREQVLLEHPSFTLSLLLPDSLLLDLLERCGPTPPRIRVGDVVLEGEPVPDALERYRFDLRSLSEAVSAELVVSLGSEIVSVLLPPGDQRTKPR